MSDLFLCKVKKKKKVVFIKKNQIFFFNVKNNIKKTFGKRIHIHEMDLLYNASHKNKKKIKKRLQPNFQFLLLNFKTCNFVTKKTFFLKKIRLYLTKIHISFEF